MKRISYLVFGLVIIVVGLAIAYFNNTIPWLFGQATPDDPLEAAIMEFQRAIELEPGNPEGYRYLGQAYKLAGQPEKVLAVNEQAIAANSDQAWPYLELERYYLAQHDPETALAASEQALQLDSENIEARLLHTIILFELGRRQEAEQFRNSAVALANGDADVYLGLGRSLIDRQEWQYVILLYEEAIAQGIRNFDIYVQLGDVYSIVGDQEQSMANYHKAAELQPYNPLLQQRLDP